MTWTLTNDVDVHAATVNDLLARQPELNSVPLSVLASLIKHGATVYGEDPPACPDRPGRG